MLLIYNDVFYWNFDLDTKKSSTSVSKSSQETHDLTSDEFEEMGITMKCSFDEYDEEREGLSLIILEVLVPSNVKEITMVCELACYELDAQWKIASKFSCNRVHDPLWKREDFRIAEHVTKGSIGVKVDILSIKYNDDSVNYVQEIALPNTARFEWHGNQQMIEKFKTFNPRSLILSDSFDAVNKNWECE